MIKRFLNKLETKAIKDRYFGEMYSAYYSLYNCYYLNKEIELENIFTPVVLYIEALEQKSNKRQQFVYESIITNFSSTWGSVINYLVDDEKVITHDVLKKEYRLESITIPKIIDKKVIKWEIDLLNVKDGFSKIIIEMDNMKPFHYSVEA